MVLNIWWTAVTVKAAYAQITLISLISRELNILAVFPTIWPSYLFAWSIIT